MKRSEEDGEQACLVKLDVEKMYPMTPRAKAMDLAMEMMENDQEFIESEVNPHEWRPQTEN